MPWLFGYLKYSFYIWSVKQKYNIMKKNLTYILKNLSQTFGIKFCIIEQGPLAATVNFNGNIDLEHLNSDMQIYCAKFGYTWSGLKNCGNQNYFAIFSF